MTMIPFNDNVRAAGAVLAEADADLVFLGSHYNFSESLISATRQELGDISSAVVTSYDDFQRMISRQSCPGILIVDEPAFRDLSDEDRAALLSLPVASLGIAFSTLQFGISCYEDDALRLRPVSIFPLNVRFDVWLSIIRMVTHGGSYVSPEITASNRPVQPRLSVEDCGLTQRQLEVLRLVADGCSNKRIAERLGLSVHTVKLHLRNINLRLGAQNRTEAAMHYRAAQS